MRKNAGLKSREEMKKLLDSGVTLYYEDYEINFIPNRIYDGRSPYLVRRTSLGYEGNVTGLWEYYDVLEIEVRWEEELKNRNILCWASDTNEVPSSKDNILLVVEYRHNSVCAYEGRYISYKYATPLTEEEKQQIWWEEWEREQVMRGFI